MIYEGASERLVVAKHEPANDFALVQTDLQVDRWDEDQVKWAKQRLEIPRDTDIQRWDFERAGISPYLTTNAYNCNLLTLTAWGVIFGGIATSGVAIVNKFSGTFGRIGAGTSTTTPTAADSKLTSDTGVSSTTSYYSLCGAAPTLNTATAPANMVFSASFAGTVANFTWQEFGTDNFNASGVTTQGLSNTIFFNHGLSSQGTKQSGQVWTATETINFGFPAGAGVVS